MNEAPVIRMQSAYDGRAQQFEVWRGMHRIASVQVHDKAGLSVEELRALFAPEAAQEVRPPPKRKPKKTSKRAA